MDNTFRCDAITGPTFTAYRINVSSAPILIAQPLPNEKRMQKLTDSPDGISLTLSLSFSPVISFAGGATVATTVGGQPLANPGPVSVVADAAICYNSMSRVASAYLAGKRIAISEGLLALHIVVGTVEITGSEAGFLKLKTQFSGSFAGQLALTGSPVYNEETKTVVLLNPRYHLESKSFLLQGARLLFARRIEKELKKAAAYSIADLLLTTQKKLDSYLNREWTKGVSGTGETGQLRILRLKAGAYHLLLQASCNASLRITINNSMLNLQG